MLYISLLVSFMYENPAASACPSPRTPARGALSLYLATLAHFGFLTPSVATPTKRHFPNSFVGHTSHLGWRFFFEPSSPAAEGFIDRRHRHHFPSATTCIGTLSSATLAQRCIRIMRKLFPITTINKTAPGGGGVPNL